RPRCREALRRIIRRNALYSGYTLSTIAVLRQHSPGRELASAGPGAPHTGTLAVPARHGTPHRPSGTRAREVARTSWRGDAHDQQPEPCGARKEAAAPPVPRRPAPHGCDGLGAGDAAPGGTRRLHRPIALPARAAPGRPPPQRRRGTPPGRARGRTTSRRR